LVGLAESLRTCEVEQVEELTDYAIDTIALILRDHVGKHLVKKARLLIERLQSIRDEHHLSQTRFTLKLIVCVDLILQKDLALLDWALPQI